MSKKLPTPDSLPDFQRLFPNEEACQDYLSALRWPDGFECPGCKSSKFYWHRDRRLIKCAACNQQVYITAGTIMHKAHTPLLTWFYAAFLATTLTPGISATQFQRQLGLSRYETAFQILHKLRAAMVNPDRDPLVGPVEVDETFIGGVQTGGEGGRSTEGRTPVVGAVEVRRSKEGGRRAGRVRFRAIPDTKGGSLIPFVHEHVEGGATVYTDAWGGYNGLAAKGYDHRPEVEGTPSRAGKILPVIHREFSNLKTWLQGTHHGRVEPQHLQAYLNEFAFRHNRRFWPFSAFQRVLGIGVGIEPQTYRDLYDADELGRNVHVSGLPGVTKGLASFDWRGKRKKLAAILRRRG